MDIRHFRYFVAVAEELSFRRAAARLNISQPPLSSQIRDLEQAIGTPLFLRVGNGIRLTEAGAFLLAPCRDLVKSYNATVALAKAAGRGEAGRLRIGFLASVTMHEMFPRMLKRFRQHYPDIALEMTHVRTGAQLDMLASDRLDIGFLRPPVPVLALQGIRMIEMWRDQMEVFFASDHPLGSESGPLDLEALAGEDFVTFAAQVGSGLFEHTVAICKRAGFVPRIVHQSGDGGAILGFVAAGLGVALLPKVYSARGVFGIMHRELRAEDSNTSVVLAMKSGNASRLVNSFIEVASEVMEPQG